MTLRGIKTENSDMTMLRANGAQSDAQRTSVNPKMPRDVETLGRASMSSPDGYDYQLLTAREAIRYIMKELDVSLPDAVKIFRWGLLTGEITAEVLQ